MKLTEPQKLTLKNLNQKFKEVIKQQQEASNSFDNHINCLKNLQKIVEEWMTFMSPYISWQINQSEKLLHVRWNIFKQQKIKHAVGEYKKLLEEINSLFFDEELKQQMKVAFEGKPVTGFNVHINDNEQTKSNRGTFFEHNHVVTYIIQFQDKTELKWYSLEDEQEMQKARKIFEKKVPQPKIEIINELTNTPIMFATVNRSTVEEERSTTNTNTETYAFCSLM